MSHKLAYYVINANYGAKFDYDVMLLSDAFISNDVAVRKSCLGVIIKVQNQGLVAPLGLLHTLIAASADPKISSLRTQADHVMHEINKVIFSFYLTSEIHSFSDNRLFMWLL